MEILEKADVANLMGDEEFRQQIIDTALSNPRLANEIVDGVAGEIHDILEDDPDFRQEFVSTASSHPEFRKSLVKELVEKFRD